MEGLCVTVQHTSINSFSSKPRLSSVKIVGRIGYLNSDPALPFMLPYGAWKVNEFADQIVRACVDYDIIATWDAAKFCALSIAKQIVKDTLKGEGEKLLGWD